MSHGKDLVERTADVSEHSKCLPAVFCEEPKRTMEKLRSGTKRGRGTCRARELRHQEDGDVQNGEKKQLESCV